jgi:hypothetical protein
LLQGVLPSSIQFEQVLPLLDPSNDPSLTKRGTFPQKVRRHSAHFSSSRHAALAWVALAAWWPPPPLQASSSLAACLPAHLFTAQHAIA